MGKIIEFNQDGFNKNKGDKSKKDGKVINLPETSIQKENKNFVDNEFFNVVRRRFNVNKISNISYENKENLKNKIEFIKNLAVPTSYDVYKESLEDLKYVNKISLIEIALKISTEEIVQRPSYSVALFNIICGQ